MEEIDFDVSNYDLNEILSILDWNNDVPLNPGMIKWKIREYKEKYKKAPKHVEFFEDVSERLLKEWEKKNKQEYVNTLNNGNAELDVKKILDDKYLGDKDIFKDLKSTTSEFVVSRKTLPGPLATRNENTMKLPNGQNYILNRVQGQKNPILRHTLKRIVNFDSHYRQILDPSSCACETNSQSICSTEVNTQIRLDTATNYTTNIDPLMNVINISFESTEIPFSWYVFSKDYGTTKLKIENKIIEITDGNYTAQQLRDTINTDISKNFSGQLYDISYNENNGKMTFNNYTSNNITLTFFLEDADALVCSATQNRVGQVGGGSKIDYNLGWLLGFRNTSGIIAPYSTLSGLSPVDTVGPRYFLITLDDFNNNKPNKDLISLTDNKATNFKLPKYFNSQSMDSRYGPGTYEKGFQGVPGYECADVAGKPSERGCAEADLNRDISSNLTQKQKYTVEQIQLARKSKSGNRYTSPNSTDLLARIPIPSNKGDLWFKTFTFRNNQPEYNQRVYFGPVKLSKFRIKLLTDKGFEVNLNERDWSFSLTVEQLYQY
jgi:hypothetical protein